MPTRSCVLVSVLALTASAQSVRTVAGGGTADGRPVLFVPVEASWMAVDSHQRLHFADSGLIRRIGANGLLETYAGTGSRSYGGDGGSAVKASLAGGGLVFDANDNLYIADHDNGRIRRVDARTGIITTIAGGGSRFQIGDGLPATAVALDVLPAVTIDRNGDIVFSQSQGIRRITKSGTLETIAGTRDLYLGDSGYSGDGGPATEALLQSPMGLAFDSDNNLYFADSNNNRIRRVDASTGTITTYAGDGKRADAGDGGPATRASLAAPLQVAFDGDGNLLIAGGGEHLRRIDARTGVISTIRVLDLPHQSLPITALTYSRGVTYTASLYTIWSFSSDPATALHIAGNGDISFKGDGGPATAGALFQPLAVSADSGGNLFIADLFGVRRVDSPSGVIHSIRSEPSNTRSLVTCGEFLYADHNFCTISRIDPQSGALTQIAGTGSSGYSGDGGPATAATFKFITGIAADKRCNLYIADFETSTVRRIDSSTGIVTTIAGDGNRGFSGDSGVATQTMLSAPSGVAIDQIGNVFIADGGNRRIIRIDPASGRFSTIASFSDEINGLTIDGSGILYCSMSSQVMRIDPTRGAVSVFAGAGPEGFAGDNGAASKALFNLGRPVDAGCALYATPHGDLYIADIRNDRVRLIPACRLVSPPALQTPADRSSGATTSPKLAWSASDGASRYDLYLATTNPPLTVAAADLELPTYSPALEPFTRYYWRVVAKGDPFCNSPSSVSSAVFSFTTIGSCSPPGVFEARGLP